MKHTYPGLLIVFEGIDGCGKGTQIDLLAHELNERGWGDRVVLYKQPGSTKLGNALRDVLFHSVGTHQMEPETCSILYLASHIQGLAEVVIPALKEGKIVISDRWDQYSGKVFGRLGLKRPVISSLHVLRDELRGPDPDLTFLICGEPSVFLQRAMSRIEETHEAGKSWAKEDTLFRLQEEYKQVIPGPVEYLQGDRDLAEVIFAEYVLPYVAVKMARKFA